MSLERKQGVEVFLPVVKSRHSPFRLTLEVCHWDCRHTGDKLRHTSTKNANWKINSFFGLVFLSRNSLYYLLLSQLEEKGDKAVR